MMPNPTPAIPTLILAAGRGERMRPLSDHTPKPLLQVRGKPLLQWHMDAMLRGGFQRAVINTAWLGEQIEAHFGSSFAVPGMGTAALQLQYSREGRDFGAALETAGGICRALPLLGDAFWVMAGDVFAPDFVMEQSAVQRFLDSGMLAHLWLVPNPPHVPLGDFGLDAASGLALNTGQAANTRGLPRYTFSTFGLYRKALFQPPWCAIAEGNAEGTRAALAPLLRLAMDQQRVSAALYTGSWTDVGTPERLQQLNA